MIRQSRNAFIFSVIFLLTACSILPSADPVAVYRLPVAEISANNSGRVAGMSGRSLTVFTPYANQFLDDGRIAVIPSGNRLSVYQGARWNDSAALVFRDRLIHDFRKNASLKGVGSERDNLLADLVLRGDLDAFQVEYQQERPVVIIKFDATLMNGQNGTVMASRYFEASEPVAGTQVPEVVEAFGRAVTRLNNDIVHWVLQR